MQKILTRTVTVGSLLATVAVIAGLGGLGAMFGKVAVENGTSARVEAYAEVLPACEQEDSRDCFWDAGESGNGEGRSFVDIGGTAYYLP